MMPLFCGADLDQADAVEPFPFDRVLDFNAGWVSTLDISRLRLPDAPAHHLFLSLSRDRRPACMGSSWRYA